MQMHMLPIEQMGKEMGKEGDKEMGKDVDKEVGKDVGELMDYEKGGWVEFPSEMIDVQWKPALSPSVCCCNA